MSNSRKGNETYNMSNVFFVKFKINDSKIILFTYLP